MNTPNTQLAVKPQTLRNLITTMQPQFQLALPKHLTAERFTRVAITALTRTPKLQDCSPESFIKCLLDLSALGIEPDGRRAHLIPYGKECTLIIDWKGLAELAQRSGQIAKLHADLICENDSFVYNLGQIHEHQIDFRLPRGKPYAAYAMAVTKDGAVYNAVLTEDEILSVRNGSQGWKAFEKGFAKQSPWDPKNPTSEREMWKKTAFRRLSKWLPLSAEFRDAVEKDDLAFDIEPAPKSGRVVLPPPVELAIAPFKSVETPAPTPEPVEDDEIPYESYDETTDTSKA